MMSTLMDLTSEYQALLDLGDSLDPEDEQTFLDTLEGLKGEIEAKADSYAVVMQTLSARANMYRTEAERLTCIADRMEKNREIMKNRVKSAMEAMGLSEIEGVFHKFKIKKNGGQAPIVITGEVPKEYTVTKTSVTVQNDKKKMYEALKAGTVLDFAYLGERGSRLELDGKG